MQRADMSPESVAEAIEKARIELLHQGPWEELRESERTARLDVLQRAMVAGGVSAGLAELQARSEAVDDLTSRLNGYRETASAERVAHERRVRELEAEVADLRERLAQAETRHAEVQEYADELDALMLGAEPQEAAAVAADRTRRGFLTRMRSTPRH